MSIVLTLVLETAFPISITQTADSWASHNEYLGAGDSEQDSVPSTRTDKNSRL